MSELIVFKKKNGLTQREIALFLGVSIPTVSRLEKTEGPIPVTYLKQLLSNSNGWDVSMLKTGADEEIEAQPLYISPSTFSHFLTINRIRTWRIAILLGVSGDDIDKLISGKESLTEEQYNTICDNKFGWDTTVLKSSKPPRNGWSRRESSQTYIKHYKRPKNSADYRQENEILREQIALLEEENQRCWDLIKKLTD